MVDQPGNDDEMLRLASAAAWRVRLTEAGLESSEAFEAWLAEDAANEAAWRQVAAPWNLLGEHATTPEVMQARRDALARAAAQGRLASREQSLASRVYRLSALAAGVIVVVAGVLWLVARPTEYRTAFGERRVVTLEDGSKVSLDSDTTVQVRYSTDARHLKLLMGQARFDVAHHAQRPFSVDAGDRTVIATGTSFNIDLRESEVVVTLIEGHVLVTSRDSRSRLPMAATPAATALSLDAGETLTAAIDTVQTPRIEQASLDTVTSWESGRLIFDDEALGDVVERVGRYARQPIVIADDRAAELRISGVFNVGDVTTFVDTVSRYLPVRATSRPDGTIVLNSADEKQ